MNRYLKWAIGIFLVLVVLVAGAAVAVRVFVSSDQMKKLAVAYGTEFVGRKIKLDTLSVGLFLVEASGFAVEGAPGAKAPLLRIEKIKAILNPTAILYKKISILSLDFVGVSVRASRDAAGRLSFQDILDRLDKPAVAARYFPPTGPGGGSFFGPARAEAAEGKPAPAPAPEFDFVVRDIDIVDVNFVFDSAAAGGRPAFRARCEFSVIEIPKFRLNEPIPVQAAGNCAEPGKIAFTAEANLDPEGKRFSFKTSFEPFDVMPFVPLAPPVEGLRLLGGILGGDLGLSVMPGKTVGWDVDLSGNDIDAEFLSPGGGSWRRKKLASFRFKSRGSFDPANEIARVAEFEAEFPFAKIRLNKEASLTTGGPVQLDLGLEVSDLGRAAAWSVPFAGLDLGKAEDGGKLSASLSLGWKRPVAAEAELTASVKFDPIEVAPYAALLPPLDTLRRLRGRVGGSVDVSFKGTKGARWKIDVEGGNLSAQVRAGRGEKWRTVKLALAGVRSEGAYDIEKKSAEVSRLDLDLPFGALKLSGPAKWNVSGRDEAGLEMKITDLESAVRTLSAVSGISLKNVPKGEKGGKFDLKMSASRDRRKEGELRLDSSVRFDPIEVAPLEAFLPRLDIARGLRGRIGGTAEVSFSTAGVARWKVDLAGSRLSARVWLNSGEKWRRLRLAGLGVRSEGSYNFLNESAEIASLEVDLPFGKMRLTEKAKWNVSGADRAALSLNISDIGAAVEVASAVSGIGLKKNDFKKGGKFDLDLSVSRSRRKKKDILTLSGAVSLDPIQVGPFAGLVPRSAGMKDVRGVVGGRLTFLLKQNENISWKTSLSGRGFRGSFDFDSDGKWGGVNLGNFEIGSDGWYDLRRGSAQVSRLDLKLPFGTFRLVKEARWNLRGRDDVSVAWNISDLSAAAGVANAAGGGITGGVIPAGSSEGSVRILRNRKKTQTFSLTGSARADLARVRFRDFPNMEAGGKASVKMDGKTVDISVSRLFVRKRKEKKNAIDLRGLRASFSQKNLFNGRIVSPRAVVESLQVNFSMNPQKVSNFEVILASGDKGKKRKAKRAGKASGVFRRAGRGKKAKPRRAKKRGADLPDVNLRRVEIGRLGFRFFHRVAEEGPPVVLEWKDLRLKIENLNTRMRPGRMDGRISLVAPGKPAPISFHSKMNPGEMPPALDGSLSLHQFSLPRVSPYAYSARGMEIRRGTLDLSSSFNLKKGYLRARVRAKVHRLDLKQVKSTAILGDAQNILQGVALQLLKQKNDVIPVNFKVEGNVDDPSFYVSRAMTEALLTGVINNLGNLPAGTKALGGKLGDILKGVLGGVIGGGGIAPRTQPPPSAPAPERQVIPPRQVIPGQRPARGGSAREVERLGKEILRGLFGR